MGLEAATPVFKVDALTNISVGTDLSSDTEIKSHNTVEQCGWFLFSGVPAYKASERPRLVGPGVGET